MTEPAAVKTAVQHPPLWITDVLAIRHRVVHLLPVGRYGIWFLAGVVVLSLAVFVRLDVQQLRKDLDRNERAQQQTQLMTQRLQLELDAQRRATALQRYADISLMNSKTPVIRVKARQ